MKVRSVVLLCVVCTCCHVRGAGASGSLHGRVLEEGYGPLVGVTVTLVAEDNSRQIASTDSSGEYLFGGLQQGVYTIQVEPDGYVPQTRSGALVPMHSNISIDFNLQPLYSAATPAATHFVQPKELSIYVGYQGSIAGGVSLVRGGGGFSWPVGDKAAFGVAAGYGRSVSNTLTYPSAVTQAPRVIVWSMQANAEYRGLKGIVPGVAVPIEWFKTEGFGHTTVWSAMGYLRLGSGRYTAVATAQLYSLSPADFGAIDSGGGLNTTLGIYGQASFSIF